MRSTYNSLLLEQLFFSCLIFLFLSFIFLPSLLFPTFSLFLMCSLFFLSFILEKVYSFSHFVSKNQGALVRLRRLRDEGNGIPATTRRWRHLWWSFLLHSLSPCLSLSLADRSQSLLSLSWRRQQQEVMVIIFADLSNLCPFFPLDNEVRNFMDND